jgi:RNA polymerase sigma factor FliA
MRTVTPQTIDDTVRVVRECGGNRSAAAKKLGCTALTVANRLANALLAGIEVAPAVRGRRTNPNVAKPRIVPKPAPTFHAADEKSRRVMWEHYVAGGRTNDAMRNYLIQAELPRLEQLAHKTSQQLAHQASPDELASEGAMGLIDAAKRYDPLSTRATFWTFASRRAVGAMLDFARGTDPIGRLFRTRSKERIAFVAKFSQQHGRAPSAEDVMAGLHWSRELYAASFPPETASLATPLYENNEGKMMALGDLLAACEHGPDGHAVTESFLRDACRGLQFDQQVMLWLYLVRGTTMKNIGVAFGMSESRISQMMTEAREHLLANMQRQNAA